MTPQEWALQQEIMRRAYPDRELNALSATVPMIPQLVPDERMEIIRRLYSTFPYLDKSREGLSIDPFKKQLNYRATF